MEIWNGFQSWRRQRREPSWYVGRRERGEEEEKWCVSVCVRERETDREREGGRVREIKRSTERYEQRESNIFFFFYSNIEHSHAQKRFKEGIDVAEVDCILL